MSKAEARSLYKEPTWLQLLHYKSSFFHSHLTSEITSQNFFLAPDGHVNPKAELEATIKAYFDDLDEPSARCRFPARYMWLSKELDFPERSQTECTEYEAWVSGYDIKDIEVIFISGYFGNPASFFGHVIVKLRNNDDQHNKLLDKTVNFGATIPPKESSLRYLYKGLTGGYDATYTQHEFYDVNQTYSEKELRHQWVYTLNLNDDQKAFLSAHLWELQDYEFKYYFVDKNCGYYIADTLQLVVDTPLLNYKLPWSFPSSIFDRLGRPLSDGRSLIKQVDFYPSRQTRFYDKYYYLDGSQRQVLKYAIAHEMDMDVDSYNALSSYDKAMVLDAFLDYQLYQSALNPGDKERQEALHQRLLQERLRLKLNSNEDHFIPRVPPHLGHTPMKAAVGLVSRESTGLWFNFRGAYYDYLSLAPARPPYSELVLMDLHFRWMTSSLSISKATLLHLEKLGVSMTGLPSDSEFGWSITSGFDRESVLSESVDHFLVKGGVGKSYLLSNGWVAGAFLDGVLLPGDIQGSYVSPRFILITNPNNKWMSYYTMALRKDSVVSHTWVTRLWYSKEYDVRVSFEKDLSEEYRLKWAYYF